jgi:Cu(I)/Ag(I) efflux system periplasmic protein CusF
MTRSIIAAALIAAAWPLASLAVEAHHQGAGASKPASGQLAEGEVRKVDKDAKKLTIRHGPIASLDMPPMTMVFQVKDAAVLETVKAGDKIRFSADKDGSAFVVNKIEVVK